LIGYCTEKSGGGGLKGPAGSAGKGKTKVPRKTENRLRGLGKKREVPKGYLEKYAGPRRGKEGLLKVYINLGIRSLFVAVLKKG